MVQVKRNLKVQKYGGSSLADEEKIRTVAKKIKSALEQGYRLAVVVSANGDTTNRLISKAKGINPSPHNRELDMLVSTGEQISASLLTMALHAEDVQAISVNAYQLGIETNQAYTEAKIRKIDTRRLHRYLTDYEVLVVTGFQGITQENEITTLGRGGSDTSAVALAATLECDCEIFSDFDGIFTVDPRIMPKAKKIERITYDEMLEMACLGANVLHNRAVEIAKKYNVRLRCASTFSDKGGTRVTENYLETPIVSGLSVMKDQTHITLSNLPQGVAINKEVFTIASSKNWNIDMISIIQVNGHLDVAFTVVESVIDDVKSTYESIFEQYEGVVIRAQTGFAKISVVGLGMRTESGVASRFFAALAKGSIHVKMVTTSEIKISVLIPQEQLETAVSCLSEEFDLCSE
ncbi:MAG: aspartate kinase [Thermotogaceae bacterium]|jgi:aspartate kinase|nr:aspartate kinase [Thermotogaceae bacterium]